jgi:hypothetical protein
MNATRAVSLCAQTEMPRTKVQKKYVYLTLGQLMRSSLSSSDDEAYGLPVGRIEGESASQWDEDVVYAASDDDNVSGDDDDNVSSSSDDNVSSSSDDNVSGSSGDNVSGDDEQSDEPELTYTPTRSTAHREEARRLMRRVRKKEASVDALVERRVAARTPAMTYEAEMDRKFAVRQLRPQDIPAAKSVLAQWTNAHGWCFAPVLAGRRAQLDFPSNAYIELSETGAVANRSGSFYATHLALFVDGKLPKHLDDQASHLCHFPECCNVEHLVWESRFVNSARNACANRGTCIRHSGAPDCVFVPHVATVYDKELRRYKSRPPGGRPLPQRSFVNHSWQRALLTTQLWSETIGASATAAASSATAAASSATAAAAAAAASSSSSSSSSTTYPTTFTLENELFCHAPQSCYLRNHKFGTKQHVCRHEMELHGFDRTKQPGYDAFLKCRLRAGGEKAWQERKRKLAAADAAADVAGDIEWTSANACYCHAPGGCSRRDRKYSTIGVKRHELDAHGYDRLNDPRYQEFVRQNRVRGGQASRGRK